MTQLIALLSSGKGSWAHVAKLMRQGDFSQTILITNDFGKEKFTSESSTHFLVVDLRQPIPTLVDTLVKELRPLVKGTQVAFNMVSGEGSEHMALLSALLKLGVGVRLVVAGDNDFIEI